MKRILLSFFLLVTLLSHQAGAFVPEKEIGEAYAKPSYKELAQTLVLMNGLDINKPEVVEDYAKMFYCDLYKEKFSSDFEWNKLKQQIISRVLEKKDMFRLQYEITDSVKFERYDFEGQFFPLDKESRLENVGSLMVLDEKGFEPYCNQNDFQSVLPSVIYIQLMQPLNVDHIRMPMDEAEKFLGVLESMKVRDRTVYIRFRVKIIEVAAVAASKYFGKVVTDRADFLGKIMQIDFFYDREMTKWIGSVPLNKPK